jgi:hypothetical protein
MTGWKQPGGYSNAFAEVISQLPLQLIDSHDLIVAEVTSDSRGYFTFPPIAAGRYELRAKSSNDVDWYFHRVITVTKSRQVCRKLVYVYPTVGGWPCRTHLTLEKPAEIKED